MKKKTVKDVSLKGKAVIVRVDYNIPYKILEKGEKVITDNTRIIQSLETIKYLEKEEVARVVLMSHLGEPGGKVDEKFSMGFIAKELEVLLKRPVIFVKDYLEEDGLKQIRSSSKGEIILLENLRFNPGEELNHPNLAKKLAKLGDVFVNDAFGSCHRAHASVVGITDFLPALAGMLLEKEIEIISKTMEEPESPFVVILGGAKATTKIPMIDRLMTRADYLLLGGGVANTFLKAFGYNVGRSVYSKEAVRFSQTLIWKATRVNTKLFLPTDVVLGSLASNYKGGECLVEEIPMQFQALDIGRKTREEYAQIIKEAKTIIWNGPMGANESRLFSKGTEAIYEAIVANKKALSVVGGGDTLASINGRDHLKNITHISTGGGAMLEFIEKGSLPGVEALSNK